MNGDELVRRHQQLERDRLRLLARMEREQTLPVSPPVELRPLRGAGRLVDQAERLIAAGTRKMERHRAYNAHRTAERRARRQRKEQDR